MLHVDDDTTFAGEIKVVTAIDQHHFNNNTASAATAALAAETAKASLKLDLSAWVVRYPWSEVDGEEGMFNSSNPMLNAVWELCKTTVKVTSLDTTTDSNTRERLPYVMPFHQHNTVQCSAVPCSAVQCSAVQCSEVQCSEVQCSTIENGCRAHLTISSQVSIPRISHSCKYARGVT